MTNRTYFYYIIPALLLLFIITVVPLMSTLTLSTLSFDLTKPDKTSFIGFKHYSNLFQDYRFINALRVTLILLIIPVTAQLIFGFALSIALNEKLAGTKWLRVFFLIPAVIPPVVIGLVWKLFFIPDLGGLSYFLNIFGISSPDLFSTPSTALMVIIIASIWTGTPFVTLMCMSSLDTISSDYYEAAAIDGASWFQQQRLITIPLILPVLKTVAIFRVLEALGIFPIIFVLTGGGPAGSTEPINFYGYVNAFSYLRLDYAAAIIVTFFVILMLFCLPILKNIVLKKQ